MKKQTIHVAVNAGGISSWCKRKDAQPLDAARAYFQKILELVRLQQEKGILIITIAMDMDTDEERIEFLNFLKKAKDEKIFEASQTRVSALGKWYGLEQEIIDAVKDAMTSTSENDRLFFNMCISYDGQEEIVTAVRKIAKRVLAGEIDPDDVDDTMMKESIYTSNFPPPQVIIETQARFSGMLLWDSEGARVEHSGKEFLELTAKDIEDMAFGKG